MHRSKLLARARNIRNRPDRCFGEHREQQKLLFFPAGHGVAGRRAKPKDVLLDVDTTARVAGIANSDFTSARRLGEPLALEERLAT